MSTSIMALYYRTERDRDGDKRDTQRGKHVPQVLNLFVLRLTETRRGGAKQPMDKKS